MVVWRKADEIDVEGDEFDSRAEMDSLELLRLDSVEDAFVAATREGGFVSVVPLVGTCAWKVDEEP